jgi:uncharacterized membrane protein
MSSITGFSFDLLMLVVVAVVGTLFVEKRFGVGYTVNFGNPLAWVVLALVVGVPITLHWLL